MTGELPDVLGTISKDENLNWIVMYTAGFAAFLVSLVLINFKSYVVPPQQEDTSAFARFLNIVSASFGMSFAWCAFYASHSLLSSVQFLKDKGVSMDKMIGRCLLALLISIVCMVVIWTMSFIERVCQRFMRFLPYGADIVLRIVTVMSVLLGFAWVSTFNAAVDIVASRTSWPGLTVTILVSTAIVVICPAWQKYIVPKTMILHAYHLRKLAGESHGNQSGLA
jgi:hypothetical protein